MANMKSAKKRIRRNGRREVINKTRLSRIRTFIKKVESAIATGDTAQAEESFKVLQPEFQRGVAKGVVNKKTASRKTSRLAKGIKKIGGKNLTATTKTAKKAAPKKTAAKKAPAKKAAAKKPAAKK